MNRLIKRIPEKNESLTDFSSVLNRIYANRNIHSKDELDYSISKLHPIDQLKGISEAANLIAEAIKNEKSITIVGDFDGDETSDIGCYFAPGGDWYIRGSSAGFYQSQFGYSGTIPLGSAQTQP